MRLKELTKNPDYMPFVDKDDGFKSDKHVSAPKFIRNDPKFR